MIAASHVQSVRLGVAIGLAACFLGVRAAPAQSPLCWRARPAPACASYLVTDFTAAIRLDPSPAAELQYLLTGEIGWMKNLGRHNAVGATVGILAHGAGDRYALIANLYPYLGAGVLLRYRYWASPHTGIELGIGTPFAGGRALGRVQVPSLVTELSLAYRGVIALTARVERTRYRQRYEGLAGVPGIGSGYPLGARPASWFVSVPDVDTAWYLGARIRSWPGALGIVASGILITISRVFYSS